jgi:hypothetical protein
MLERLASITESKPARMLQRLVSITEQANDLQALLFAGAELPVQLSAEMLRLLGRRDDDLSELVQRIGEAGSEG